MTKPISSREKARSWARKHGHPVKAQPKPGTGKPLANCWVIVDEELRDIPPGRPWLLKAADGATLRVMLKDDETQAGFDMIKAVKMLRELEGIQAGAARSLSVVAELQETQLKSMREQQAQQQEGQDRLDKTMAEMARSQSLHQVAERLIGAFTTYVVGKRQNLLPEDQALLEEYFTAKAKLTATRTVRAISDSLGLAEEEAKGRPRQRKAS